MALLVGQLMCAFVVATASPTTLRYKITGESKLGLGTEHEFMKAFGKHLNLKGSKRVRVDRVADEENRGEGYLIQIYESDRIMRVRVYYGSYAEGVSEARFIYENAKSGENKCTNWDAAEGECIEVQRDKKPGDLSIGTRLGKDVGTVVGGDWEKIYSPGPKRQGDSGDVIGRIDLLGDDIVAVGEKLESALDEVKVCCEERAKDHKALSTEHDRLAQGVGTHDDEMSQRLSTVEGKVDEALKLLRADQQEDEPGPRVRGEFELNIGGGVARWRKGQAFFEDVFRPTSFSLGTRSRLEWGLGGHRRFGLGVESAADFNPAPRYSGEIKVSAPMRNDADDGDGTLSYFVEGRAFMYDMVMRVSGQYIWELRTTYGLQGMGPSLAFGAGVMGVYFHFDGVPGDYSAGDIDGVLSLEAALKLYFRRVMVSGRFLYRGVPYVKDNERELHVFSFGLGLGAWVGRDR